MHILVSTERRTMGRSKSGPNGFTLIELLVVLAILGIATMAIVSFSVDRQGKAVKGLAGDVYGLLREAQAFARVSGQDVYLASEGSGRALIIRYGTYPLDSDGNIDFTTMRIQGSLSMAPQHAAYAKCDASGADYSKVSPKSDILKPIEGNNYVATGALPLLPATPSDGAKRFFFQSNGNLNQAFYCAVVGLRGDSPYGDAPVAVVSGVPGTGVRGYFTVSASAGIWRVM